jgi:hypothetical protein
MRIASRAFAVILVALLSEGGLKAQRKTEVQKAKVKIDALILQTGQSPSHQPLAITSPAGVESLNELLRDAQTKILSHPELRTRDGVTATVRIGNRLPAGVATNLEITPRTYAPEGLRLHVVLSQHVNMAVFANPAIGEVRNTFEVNLQDAGLTILSGLKSLSGDPDSQLAIALTAKIVH